MAFVAEAIVTLTIVETTELTVDRRNHGTYSGYCRFWLTKKRQNIRCSLFAIFISYHRICFSSDIFKQILLKSIRPNC